MVLVKGRVWTCPFISKKKGVEVKKAIRNILPVILIVVVLAVSFGVVFNPGEVMASGTTTVYYDVHAGGAADYACEYGSDNWSTWPISCGMGGIKYSTNQLKAGWQSRTSPEGDFKLQEGIVGFDVTDLPDDAVIISARVLLYADARANTSVDWTAHFALYSTYPAGATLIDADWGSAYQFGNRLSGPESYSDISLGVYTNFYLYDYLTNDWEYLRGDENDVAWFTVMTTNHALNLEPSWESYKSIYIQWDKNAVPNGQAPRLMIEYVGEPAPRAGAVVDNDATDNTTDGTEVCDNVTWHSPRCAYADDIYTVDSADVSGVLFYCSGESGAVLDLSLVNQAGTELYSHTDSIRVDGEYFWGIDVSNSTDSLVRVIENNTGVSSEWGYISPSPGNDQPSVSIMAKDTDYPHYLRNFSDFVVYKDELAFLHYKTNIDGETELPLFSLRFWYLGRSGNEIYNETLADLATNYFKNDADNNVLLHWRYVVFTPDAGSGFEDYDGLIIDLDQGYKSSTSGFYQGLIYSDNTTEELTVHHSGHWYLDNAIKGITSGLDLTTYAVLTIPTLTVGVGDASRARDYLNIIYLYIIDDDDDVVWSDADSLSGSTNTYYLGAVATPGEYVVRFILADGGTTFTYSHDIPFTVGISPGGVPGVDVAESIWDRFMATLSDWGLDNPIGQWLIMLVLMFIAFMVFHKSETMRVAMPMLIMGVFIVAGWVDTWVIILLALGAGFTLWNLFRKKVSGGA